MKILVIGCLGQVAWELRRELACLGTVIAVDRHTQPYAIDLTDNDSIVRTVTAIRPAVIVNAAAYTAVDKAEQADCVAAAMQVNGHAMGVLADVAKQQQAVLVHYSTDYVFDGTATTPYLETAATAPQGVYGHSKLLGEQAILASGVEHLILRTAWVYGGRGSNFLLTMLRLMQTKDKLGIVADQLGSPTWSRHIAAATALMLVQQRSKTGIDLADQQGVYNLTSAGYGSWFDFATHIYQEARRLGIFQQEVILNALQTSEYPTAAKRPAYSVLSGDKLAEQFFIRLPDWRQAVSDCLADYVLHR